MVRITATQTGVLNSVDMSNWSGPLTPEEARCFKDLGVRILVVGSGHPLGAGLHARQQAECWLQEGGELLGAYRYHTFTDDPDEQITNATTTLEDLPIYHWWCDIEDSPSADQLTLQQRWDYVDRALELHDRAPASVPTAIYTAEYFWEGWMGLSARWANRDLIDARYSDGASDSNPLFQQWAGREYGGWLAPAAFQYQGDFELCGQAVDLVYYPDLPPRGQVPAPRVHTGIHPLPDTL